MSGLTLHAEGYVFDDGANLRHMTWCPELRVQSFVCLSVFCLQSDLRTTIQHADGDLAVAITTTYDCPPITLNMTSGFGLSLTRQ